MLRYLLATSGHPNYGDELITAAWLRDLAARHPDDEVVVDAPQAGGSAALHGHLHPRARFVDTVFRVAEEAGSLDPWRVAAHVRAAVDDHGVAPRWQAGLQLLDRADVVHVLGGGWVNDLWPLNTAALAAASAVARRGVRSAVTGTGLLPSAPSTAALVRSLVAGLDVVEVRDQGSLDLLQGAPGVELGPDDAFLGLGAGTWSGAEDLPPVMVCVQSDVLGAADSPSSRQRTPEEVLPRLAAAVLEQLRAWDVDGAEVGVLECIPRVDRWVLDDVLAPHLPGARFFSLAEVLRDGFPARPGQTWLTTRYHPHLLAAARGARGVCLDVRPDYYGAKHEALRGLGSAFVQRGLDDAPVPVPDRAGGLDGDALARRKAAVAQRVHPDGPARAAEDPSAATPAADLGRPRGWARLTGR